MKTKKQRQESTKNDTKDTKKDVDSIPEYVKTLDGIQIVQEGSAQILYNDHVFYNPIQEFNRDLSIAAIKVFSEMFLRDKVVADLKKRKRESSTHTNGNKDEIIKSAETSAESALAESTSDSEETEATPSPDKSKEQIRAENQLRAIKKASRKVNFEKIDLNSPDYANKSISIFEALSATGLRSIRYAKEIPHVSKIVANDMDSDAVKAIQNNIEHNNVGDIVSTSQGDARLVMYQMLAEKAHYDVIDLDPYGTASPFLDAAVQAVSSGGLLCVTCTDAAVLAGSQPESCWAKYGSINIPQAPYTHELALRIMLHAIQSAAARYSRFIEPLASCSIDYYFRVFVRVHESKTAVKQASTKTAMVYHCSGCKSFNLQPIGKPQTANGRFGPAVAPTVGDICKLCQRVYHIAGPFYSKPIHNDEFLCRLLDHLYVTSTSPSSYKYGTLTRMSGMLTVMSEEIESPLYFSLPQMCNVLHCSTLSRTAFASAILNLEKGYTVSSSHCQPQSIKTNAPHEVLWDILRCWCKKNPVKSSDTSSPGGAILSKEPSFDANFTKHRDAEPLSQKLRLVRFQENPTANWGPQSRPKKKTKSE